MNNKYLNVLLVEDDDVAAEAVCRSFTQYNLHFPITHACDGIEALDVLLGKHPEKKIQKPFIVLLDLNMPRMNGFEFLESLRRNNEISDSVIFVLTTSNADTDRTRAYNENIAGYMVKSALGPQFANMIRLLENYRDAVQLPGDR